MARLITERIAELRKEIAKLQLEIVKLQSTSHLASISIPYQNRAATQQRHEQRLKEIMEELRSLTSWKKP